MTQKQNRKAKWYKVIGILFFIFGIIFGLYVGGWLMFVKPIIEAAQAFDSDTLTGAMIAITVLKCVFASAVGSFIYCICCLISNVLNMLSTDYD